MRRIHLARCLLLAVGGVLAFSSSLPALSAEATSSGTPSAVPADPHDLIRRAAAMNRLAAADVKPFRLKVSFTLFDDSGNITDHGIAEALWISHDTYKLVYSGQTFSRSYYRTKKGNTYSGTTVPESLFLSSGLSELLWPIPSEKLLGKLGFQLQSQQATDTALTCLTMRDPRDPKLHWFLEEMFCLEPNSAALRIHRPSFEFHQLLRDNIFSFQGRFVPRDITAVLENKTRMTLHVDELQALDAIDPDGTKPPQDAKAEPETIPADLDEAQMLVVPHPDPTSPVPAGGLSAETVSLFVVIGPDGRVESLYPIGGPNDLRPAAVDAVSKLPFHPTVLSGGPARVTTVMFVKFSRKAHKTN